MIYLKNFYLPGDREETDFVLYEEKRTCFPSFYPFNIFPLKGLDEVTFDSPITTFYGGNGSGKSTLINVMARKVHAVRYSDFNDAPLFDRFVEKCTAEFRRYPAAAYVLTSDDVFDYALSARSVNENIIDRRQDLFERYNEIMEEASKDPSVGWLGGLDDYERWSEVREVLSPKRSQSSYVKKRMVRDIELHSNGETAMRYFLDRIDQDAIYFLDEPENSLSIELQIQLADYIVATARATKSQFIIATHSPVLLAMQGSTVYNLDEYPVGVCDWTELPNVRRYFDFFMEHAEEFE